jgi:hypothetical protein
MMDDVKSPNDDSSRVHPLMPPEERRALWHHARKVWKQLAQDMIAAIEQSRAEWQERTPQ